MAGFIRFGLGAAFFVLMMTEPNGAHALVSGAKTQPATQSLKLARRECISGYYDDQGRFHCTAWSDCKPGDNVC